MTKLFYNIFEPGKLEASGRLGVHVATHLSEPPDFLVSAVMVSRGNIEFISRSIRMFIAQSWPYKELVLVTDKVSEELYNLSSAFGGLIQLIEAPSGLNLGDYRNISVARARGNFICQWDDDDFYHRDRISSMMSVLFSSDADAVFLSRWLMRWESREWIAISNARVWEGSFLARKHAIRVYPSMSRGEDTVMVNALLRRSTVAMLDAPHLYCYSVTDRNTWSISHFEDLFKAADHVFVDAEYQKALDSFECFETLR